MSLALTFDYTNFQMAFRRIANDKQMSFDDDKYLNSDWMWPLPFAV